MIVGINWTGHSEDIALLEKFRRQANLPKVIKGHGLTLRLKGITDKVQEANLMMGAASNSRRTLFDKRGRKGLIGIYVS